MKVLLLFIILLIIYKRKYENFYTINEETNINYYLIKLYDLEKKYDDLQNKLNNLTSNEFSAETLRDDIIIIENRLNTLEEIFENFKDKVHSYHSYYSNQIR